MGVLVHLRITLGLKVMQLFRRILGAVVFSPLGGHEESLGGQVRLRKKPRVELRAGKFWLKDRFFGSVTPLSSAGDGLVVVDLALSGAAG